MGGKGKGGRGGRPIENIFYGQPTAASSSRRNCDGLGVVAAAAAAQNELRSILPLMNGLEDGAAMALMLAGKWVHECTLLYRLHYLLRNNEDGLMECYLKPPERFYVLIRSKYRGVFYT